MSRPAVAFLLRVSGVLSPWPSDSDATYGGSVDAGAGQGYLDNLTDEDLRVLAVSARLDETRSGELRRQPATVSDLVRRPELFDRLYGQHPDGVVSVSPFFAFVVAVERAARELEGTPFVAERFAPRHRGPGFDAPRLRDLF